MAFSVNYIFQARDKFTAVAKKIKRSVQGVQQSVNRASAGFRNAGSVAAQSFRGNVLPALSAVKEKLAGMSSSLRSFGKATAAVGAKLTFVATVPIALLGRNLIKAASDSEETRAKFNTVFRDISAASERTADSLANNFGLAGTKARELLGDTGDLLTGFGFTQESSLELSRQVNELAVDLASFTNFSGGAEGASKALTKALLGERESVKSLGISILEEDVKARVRQLVLVDKMKFATERQAKAFATLQLAQEQSKNAIGDFNRTSAGYANQVRIMEGKTQDLREALGVHLLPIALKVVQAIASLAQKFTNTSPAVKKMVVAVGALIAITGPLLVIVGGLVFAIGAISAPVALAIAALVALGVAGAVFSSEISAAWEGAVAATSKLFAAWAEIWTGMEEVLQPFIGAIGEIIDPLLPAFQGISHGIKSTFAEATAFVIENFVALVEKIQSILAPVLDFFKPLGEGIAAIFKPLTDVLTSPDLFKTPEIPGEIKTAVTGTPPNLSVIDGGLPAVPGPVVQTNNSKAAIDVNIKAPAGVVDSVKAKDASGDSLNLGVNMQSTS